MLLNVDAPAAPITTFRRVGLLSVIRESCYYMTGTVLTFRFGALSASIVRI